MKSESRAKRLENNPQLNPESIGAAALEIIDKRGLSALTARALAAALGCEAMSLYHHVPNMDAVRDLVVEQLLSQLTLDDSLRQIALRYLELAEAHPHAFLLVATRRWRTASAIATATSLLHRHVHNGMAPRVAVTQMRILAAYLNGAGLALAAWQLDANVSDDDDIELAFFEGARNLASVKADLIAGLENLLPADRNSA